jgi:Leucine-rich repeat (LRR) protein
MRNKLTNTIPTEIGNLLNLTVLDLFNNVLTGVLPHHLGRLTKLQHLDVSRNKLTGVVPSEITKLGLTYFQLNGNLWQPI